MSALRVGLVGAGRIGSAYLQAAEALDCIELVAIADVDGGVAERLAAPYGCDSFASYIDLAESARPEAVVICTPPATHTSISIDLLGRGVHVMCEKPLALSVSDAFRMLSEAEARGVILTMASKFRYVEDVVRARAILSSGVLGDIILLENTFASRVEMSDRWNSDLDTAGGGVLIDNGTHSVDLVRFFLGPIAEVMAVEGKRAQNLEVEDTAQLFLRAVDGARATIDLSWSIDKERDWYLEIYGSQGTIQVGWRTSRYRQRTSTDWVHFGSGYHKTQALGAQLTNFAYAIANREPLRISGVDAVASVEVMEAAYRSLSQDDWIKVGTSRLLAPR